MREPIRDKNRWEHIVKWIVPLFMSYEMTSSLFAGRWLFSLKPLIGTNGASRKRIIINRNTIHRMFRLLLLPCLLFCCLVSFASDKEVLVSKYAHWKEMPSWDLFHMTNRFLHTNKTDSALVCCTILANRYDKKMKTEEKGVCVGAMVMASNLYMNVYYDYNRAEQYILQAEKIASDHGYDMQLADIYEIEASMHSYRLDFQNNFAYDPKTIELHQKAFYQSKQSHVDHTVLISFFNMAYGVMKNFRLKDIEKELEVMKSTSFADTVPMIAYARVLTDGLLLYKEKDYAGALKQFKELEGLSDNKAHENSRKRFLSQTYVYEYVTLIEMQRFADALNILDELEKLWKDDEINDVLVEVYQMKQAFYQERGDQQKAREYELLYMRAKDAFIRKCNLVKSNEAKFLFQLHEIGEEVKDLNHQRKVREIIILGVALLTLLIIIALILVWHDNKKTQQRNRLLYKQNLELLALEKERKKLEQQSRQEHEKYKNSPMDEETKDELQRRLIDIMDSDPSIYEEGFTLDSLAVLAQANPNYVSQVINEKCHCNFNTFLNEYRIKEACRRMHNKEYRNLTIEGIGQSVGFKSRANFAATFKKFTGLTPTAYQKLAKEDNSTNAKNHERKNK